MIKGNLSLGLDDLLSDVRPPIWIYPRIYTKITDTRCFVLTGLSSLTFVARLESILSTSDILLLLYNNALIHMVITTIMLLNNKGYYNTGHFKMH